MTTVVIVIFAFGLSLACAARYLDIPTARHSIERECWILAGCIFFALLFTEVDFDPLWTGPVFLRHFPFRASQAGVEGFLFTFLVVYGAVQLARSLIWAARTRKPK